MNYISIVQRFDPLFDENWTPWDVVCIFHVNRLMSVIIHALTFFLISIPKDLKKSFFEVEILLTAAKKL